MKLRYYTWRDHFNEMLFIIHGTLIPTLLMVAALDFSIPSALVLVTFVVRNYWHGHQTRLNVNILSSIHSFKTILEVDSSSLKVKDLSL